MLQVQTKRNYINKIKREGLKSACQNIDNDLTKGWNVTGSKNNQTKEKKKSIKNRYTLVVTNGEQNSSIAIPKPSLDKKWWMGKMVNWDKALNTENGRRW